MANIKCTMISQSIGIHVQQLYTGFWMLAQEGLIDLDQRTQKKDPSETRVGTFRNPGGTHLTVIVDDSIRLSYDVHDSFEIDEACLSETDYYFKRSFSPDFVNQYGSAVKAKLRPLGLNYKVYPNGVDRFGIARSLVLGNTREKIYNGYAALNVCNWLTYIPRIDDMWAVPCYEAEPRILCMLRVYDPDDRPDWPREKIEQRRQINETRVKCIKGLRKEFGSRFTGGLMHTELAVARYKDCLLPDNSLTSKKNYINALRSHSIGLATTGLHGSIGWKFAEYVAFSKAILSERLNYAVTGNLEKDRNYLEFGSADDCVEKAVRLFSDRELRNRLMENNSKYYRAYLRPDALVLNSLLAARSASNDDVIVP